MRNKFIYILLLIPILISSCCWIPDTTCYPQLLSQNEKNQIKYLTSCCDYNNYGYINHVNNKNKPKRFCFLDLFVESDSVYKINKKNITLLSNSGKIKRKKVLLGSCHLYQGVNMISIPIKTCLFSNDTINVVIKSDEGTILMNTCLLADESLSETFRLLGSDTTYIDSVWSESMRNKYIHGELPKYNLERDAMEFSLKAIKENTRNK